MRPRSGRLLWLPSSLFLALFASLEGVSPAEPPAEEASGQAAREGTGTPDPGTIRLRAGEFDPRRGVPEFPGLPAETRYPEGVRGSYLVQFDRPIRAGDRSALESAGASVKGYVPMMTLEVVMTEAARRKVETLPGVRWVGVHQPGFKIERVLLEKYGPPFDPEGTIQLQVNLFPGEGEEARQPILALGGRILRADAGRSYDLFEVEILAGRLAEVARIPQVRFIEEIYQRVEMNDRSRFHTGLTDVANDTFTAGLDPSLDGFSESFPFQVKYGHFDGGMSFAHADFQPGIGNGWITAEAGSNTTDSSSGHGTHTAASVVGDGGLWSTVPQVPPQSGAIAQNRWRGIQPQARLHHISFQTNYTDRQVFERESEVGAHIATNSWGYVNVQQQPITTYNSNAAVWDEGVWDADDDVAGQQALVVFFSAGNNGGFNSPYNGCLSSGPDLVGTPGLAKNVITVGNNETDRGAGGACAGTSSNFSTLGDNVEQMNASSSRGPVDPDGTGQGLFKPDVTNIGGYWVMSAESLGTASECSTQFVLADCPDDCSDTGPNYAYENGTSMSTPLTAGLGGVLFQDLVVNRGVASPKPSLIKALLVNGARELLPAACNYTLVVDQSVIHQGWGFVQAKNSLYGPAGTKAVRNVDFENEITGNALATGATYQKQIAVNAGAPLKVTLAWTDFPAASGSGSPLVVNDLDLELSGPGGTFLGNNFGDAWSVAGGSPDRYNVVENVFLQVPAGGVYTITVRGFQVSQDQEPGKAGVNQDFSLVWSGAVVHAVCGDTVCEGLETSCSCAQDCGPPPANETVCDNGLDDDCDGPVDCADADCAAEIRCQAVCGDLICYPGETCFSCPGDCPSGSGAACGNGVCEVADGEDCLNCPGDCRGVTGGPPSGRFCCGSDVDCADSRCTSSGFACTGTPNVAFCCGDSACQAGEDPASCPVDCATAAGAVPDGNPVPGLPLGVTATVTGDLVLTWTPSCMASDTDYEVYEGTLGDFTSHTPLLCSTGGATSVTLTPGSGSRYYLVVPRNFTIEGSHGFRSDATQRPRGPVNCLPQTVGACQ